MIDVNERNGVFVNLAHACLGRLSPNVRRVDFAMDAYQAFRVRVVLREESQNDREELREAMEDFEASTRQPPYDLPFDVALEIRIDTDPLRWRTEDDGFLGLYWEKQD